MGSSHCVRVVGRDMRPAAHLLSFASPKESRQRKGDPIAAPALRAGALRSERLEGRRARTRSAFGCARTCARSQKTMRAARAALQPLEPPAPPDGALDGQALRAGRNAKGGCAPLAPRPDRRTSGSPLAWHATDMSLSSVCCGGKGQRPLFTRRDAPSRSFVFGPRLEAPEELGLEGRRARSALRLLTSCECLSVMSEANRASSRTTALKHMLRREVFAHAKTAGTGRLSFAFFSLAKQRKEGAPPGAHPGQRPSRSEKKAIQRASGGLRQAQPERVRGTHAAPRPRPRQESPPIPSLFRRLR
jgi:hypothetical protein